MIFIEIHLLFSTVILDSKEFNSRASKLVLVIDSCQVTWQWSVEWNVALMHICIYAYIHKYIIYTCSSNNWIQFMYYCCTTIDYPVTIYIYIYVWYNASGWCPNLWCVTCDGTLPIFSTLHCKSGHHLRTASEESWRSTINGWTLKYQWHTITVMHSGSDWILPV